MFLHHGTRGLLPVVHQMSIDSVHWGDWTHVPRTAFEEHCRDFINGRNDLPVPAHFNSTNHTLDDMKVVVLKEGLANQDYRKKQEMSLIFKYGTMCPSVTLTKTLVSHESLFFAYLHTGTRYFMWHVCKCSIRHVS